MPVGLEDQYDKIYRYCYTRVHNRELAEDLTQETFLRFLENPQYNGSGKELQYLYTIAKNLCIDEYRKKKFEPIHSADENKTDVEDELISRLSLRFAVESLSDEDREIVLLRYVNEVPVSVISNLYHMSRFALYRRLKKILAVLRSEFEKEGSE